MPQTLNIGILVLGAVMLLLALASGGFKIFGAEIPGVASRPGRVLAFVIGVVLVGFSLYHFQGEPAAKAAKAADPPAVSAAPPSDPAVKPAPPAPDLPDTPPPVKPAPREALNDPSAVRTFGREGIDYGVPPRNAIEPNVGTLTPLSIPGAQTITTGELYNAQRTGRRFLLVDVLDSPHAGLPGARRYPGVGMADPQADLAQLLDKDTGGAKAYPVVFYCRGPQCWESYNAALRARDAGYTNVYWYRGGLEAWTQANLPLS